MGWDGTNSHEINLESVLTEPINIWQERIHNDWSWVKKYSISPGFLKSFFSSAESRLTHFPLHWKDFWRVCRPCILLYTTNITPFFTKEETVYSKASFSTGSGLKIAALGGRGLLKISFVLLFRFDGVMGVASIASSWNLSNMTFRCKAEPSITGLLRPLKLLGIHISFTRPRFAASSSYSNIPNIFLFLQYTRYMFFLCLEFLSHLYLIVTFLWIRSNLPPRIEKSILERISGWLITHCNPFKAPQLTFTFCCKLPKCKIYAFLG